MSTRHARPDDGRPATPCSQLSELFYGPDVDGRTDPEREERERVAKAVCGTCPVRLPCLERALVWGEPLGVWGGMGEGERRAFLRHLRREGYSKGEVPTGSELWAAVLSFYRHEQEAADDVGGEPRFTPPEDLGYDEERTA